MPHRHYVACILAEDAKYQLQRIGTMFTHSDFAAIAALDLDRIKTKLCHATSGEGWSRARADAAEQAYRHFLYRIKTCPHGSMVPSVEVDTFWHYHILDTRRYADDCVAALGYFLHHDPVQGLDGTDQAAYCGASVGHARSYCGAAIGNAVSYCGASIPARAAMACTAAVTSG